MQNYPYNIYNARARRKLKLELIKAYGGKCECCGVKEPEFLTLEHINHDRKQASYDEYRRLKRLGFPKDGYAILCYNCNMATRNDHMDFCPHKINRANQLVKERILLN